MTITSASLAAALKELYSGQRVNNLVYDETHRPFLSKVKKNTNFSGSVHPLPVIWEDVVGISSAFSVAQGNIAASKVGSFDIDVVDTHGVAAIDTEAQLRSRNDKGAFLRGVQHTVDSLLNRMSNDLESSLFRDGTGTLGTVASVSTLTFTLTNASDIVNFYVGQKLSFAASAASNIRAGGPATVTVVDRQNGTFTVDANPASGVADDLVFNEGDYVSANDKNKIFGLPAWLKDTTGEASFLGQVRTADDRRLAGVKTAGSSSDIEGSIIDCAHDLGRDAGGVPDTVFMSYLNFRKLVKEMGAKVQRDQGATGQGGFRYLEVYGPKGLLTVHPAAYCQDDKIYVLNMSTWCLFSMGEPITLDTLDGNRMLRKSNASASEIRAYSFVQLGCNAPGRNGVVNL
ncbi:MAG: hypothetical protein QNJ16_18825 [Rhodobacter sp.]|nr:hypothetical protein [Rhodobacter sp.]